MSDVKITRDVYKQYAHKIATVLDNEEFYEQFKKRVDSGASNFKLGKKRLIQDISIDWIDTIEEILPNLDTIVRNPRRFIVQEEDIVDVSLARSISTESVKFLAQHTNMISKVEDDGSVIPSKILNITKEESFEIYENRFIYTLLLKLKDFVTMRYDKIKKASATQDVLELDVESRFNLPSKKITFRTEYFAQLSFDEVMRLDPDTLTKIERVAKIDRIITDFLSSSFAKSMRNSAPVRPPIMRTNVILKEPNFKKALVLWQFIETYNQTAGFSTTDDVEDLKLEDESIENLRHMVTLNTMLFESMYEDFETDMDMEDKQFGDFLRVGDMDFEKDEIDRDEYAQKLEQKKKDDEDDKNIEEVRPEEQPDAEHEIPPEEQPEEEQQPDETPKPEEKTKEEEKQVVQEKEVERPVEVERFREMAPKADQEEVDLEPDAVKFDQHLFEVRKLYKRPDDDKLKQEDIAKVRDAIDRCLTSYRRIKQEELDELERQDRIRRRKEDMVKRALAFSKQREELSKSVDKMDSSDVYFGIDPFSYQKAKVAQQKLEEERLERLKLNKNEQLELEGDKEEIAKEIDEMEARFAEQQIEEPEQPETEQAPEQPEFNEPANEEDLPEKKGLRLSHGDQNVDPWAEKSDKPAKDIQKVDEDKVKVGGITFKDGTDVDNPYGALTGITSNKAEVRKEEPEQSEAPAEESEKPKRKPRKRKAAKTSDEDTAAPQENAQSEGEAKQDESAPEQSEQKPSENENSEQNLSENENSEQNLSENENSEQSTAEQEEEPQGEDRPDEDNVAEQPAQAEESEQDGEKPADDDVKPEEPAAEGDKPADDVKPEEHADGDKGEDKPAEGTSDSAEKQPEQLAPKSKKRRSAKKKGELSPTTVNQKYSKPSGKQRNIQKIDEDKVKVGGITFKDGSGIFDPFSERAAEDLSNMAETINENTPQDDMADGSQPVPETPSESVQEPLTSAPVESESAPSEAAPDEKEDK